MILEFGVKKPNELQCTFKRLIGALRFSKMLFKTIRMTKVLTTISLRIFNIYFYVI